MRFLGGHDLPTLDDWRAAAAAILEAHQPTEPAPRPWRTPGEEERDAPPFASTYQAIEFAWTVLRDGYTSKSPGDPHRIARLAAYGGGSGAGSMDPGHRHVEAAREPTRALVSAYTAPCPVSLQEDLWLTPDVQLAILLCRVLGTTGGRTSLKRIAAELEEAWGIRCAPKRLGQIARAGLMRIHRDLRGRRLVPANPKLETEEDDVEHDLKGWGEIASYLNVSIPGARKYARLHGLPVHKFIGMVVARRSALDAWVRDNTRPVHSRSAK